MKKPPAGLQVPLALNLSITLEDKSLKTNKERKIAFGQIDHVRLYGMDYLDKLQMAENSERLKESDI